MYHPTTRVLTVLEMLQSQRSLTGAQIAEHLEVDIRTARRYIEMLDELGIPVAAERGRYGGYRLMPGYKLPPLMFNEDEALAVVLGLMAASRSGLTAGPQGIEGALAKIERVLPDKVKRRVAAVRDTLTWDQAERGRVSVDPAIVLELGAASRKTRQVSLEYQSYDGPQTTRVFDPYGLACRRGRWYAIGYCHLRDDVRLFRLDRVAKAEVLETRFTPPKDFDVLGEVWKSLGSIPKTHPIEVELHTSLENARSHVSAEVAMLEEIDSERVLLRGYTYDTDWFAHLLAGMGCRIDVRYPQELRDAVAAHARNLLGWMEPLNPR